MRNKEFRKVSTPDEITVSSNQCKHVNIECLINLLDLCKHHLPSGDIIRCSSLEFKDKVSTNIYYEASYSYFNNLLLWRHMAIL